MNSDPFMEAALAEAHTGADEGGIPRVVIGENTTFQGEEELLRNRGVQVTVLNDARCIELMHNFIQNHPELWFEDIGTITREDP